MQILGVDIGGTGIKAAPVDMTTGMLVAGRVKLATPQPAEPDALAAIVRELVTGFGWKGPVGIAFLVIPSVITPGKAMPTGSRGRRPTSTRPGSGWPPGPSSARPPACRST